MGLLGGVCFLGWWTASKGDRATSTIDCGANCLADAMSLLDVPCDREELSNQLHEHGESGTTFADIQRVAERHGLVAEGFRLQAKELLEQSPPCIAFVRSSHYVTIAAMDRDNGRVLVLDRPQLAKWVPVAVFSKEWGGEVLLLSRNGGTPIAPQLWIPDGQINLGLFRGTQRERTEATVVNIGDSPLTVRKARFSCQCAEVTFAPPVIPAHGASTATFWVDTRAKGEGDFDLTMLVETDSPNEKLHPVNLVGKVRRGFGASPAFFALGDVPATERERVLSTRLQFVKGTVVSLQPASLDDGLTWKGWRAVGDGEYEVQFALDATQVKPAHDGRFNCLLVIGTDSPDDPGIGIKIVGRRLEPVSITPSKLFLGRVQPGQQVRRRVRLSGATGSDQVLLVHESSAKQPVAAAGSPEPSAPGQAAIQCAFSPPWVTITVSAPTKTGVFAESCLLKVGAHEVPLDVVGVVRQE